MIIYLIKLQTFICYILNLLIKLTYRDYNCVLMLYTYKNYLNTLLFNYRSEHLKKLQINYK